MFKRWAFLAVALCAAVSVAGCGSRTIEYETVEAELGDVRDVIPAVGTVKPETQIEVRADAPGRVVAVLVEANGRVVAGQVMARIKPDRLALDVDGARAEKAAADAGVREAAARAEQAERFLASRRRLSESGFISPAGLSQAEGDVRNAAASLDRAKAEVARATARLGAATDLLGDVLIRAPTNGFVLARDVNVGQVVAPASETPLFVIASATEQVVVEAMVAEPDIGRITPDARIRFAVEAYPNQRFDGRLIEILRYPRTDRNFVSYPVRLMAENPEGKLFPGMTAAVEFIHADARRVLRVPVEALYFKPEGHVPKLSPELMRRLERQGLTDPIALDGAEMGTLFRTGRHRVFVMTDQGPQMRAIRLGAESPDYVEVTEGLQAGERIVTGRASQTPRAG